MEGSRPSISQFGTGAGSYARIRWPVMASRFMPIFIAKAPRCESRSEIKSRGNAHEQLSYFCDEGSDSAAYLDSGNRRVCPGTSGIAGQAECRDQTADSLQRRCQDS